MAADENKKIRRKVRSAYLISTVSIALVLFLLGAVGYLTLGALNAADNLRENVTVYVMLDDGLTADQTKQINTRLSDLPAVKEVTYVTKEQAAEDFQNYLGDNFVEFLEMNPLPNSFEVKLNADASNKDSIAVLEKKALAWTGVKEVEYQRNVVEQIGSNINKFTLVLLFFGVTLLVISLILLNNTIRITILSKRYIINTMKLVGATRGFIMKPFLRNGFLQGVFAAVIAMAMLLLMIMGLNEGLPDVHFIRSNTPLLLIFAALLVGGVLISLLFTIFAVRKFIRMNSSKINIY